MEKLLNFLIVDDSKYAREGISKFLNKLKHEIIAEAEDGLAAIEVYKECNPDIVTMDFEMPNMRGLDAAKEILSMNPEAKIIIITSIVDKKDILYAQKVGVKKILIKPISLKDLKCAIEEIEKMDS